MTISRAARAAAGQSAYCLDSARRFIKEQSLADVNVRVAAVDAALRLKACTPSGDQQVLQAWAPCLGDAPRACTSLQRLQAQLCSHGVGLCYAHAIPILLLLPPAPLLGILVPPSFPICVPVPAQLLHCQRLRHAGPSRRTTLRSPSTDLSLVARTCPCLCRGPGPGPCPGPGLRDVAPCRPCHHHVARGAAPARGPCPSLCPAPSLSSCISPKQPPTTHTWQR